MTMMMCHSYQTLQNYNHLNHVSWEHSKQVESLESVFKCSSNLFFWSVCLCDPMETEIIKWLNTNLVMISEMCVWGVSVPVCKTSSEQMRHDLCTDRRPAVSDNHERLEGCTIPTTEPAACHTNRENTEGQTHNDSYGWYSGSLKDDACLVLCQFRAKPPVSAVVRH